MQPSAALTSIGVRAASLRFFSLFAYGVLGLPLAFVALPIYVHVPKLYSDHFGLSLTVVGGVLLAARIWDAIIDPVIGHVGDRFGHRKLAIALAVPLLIVGLFGLLQPPDNVVGTGWLAAMLFIVYLGYSLATVNHCAWGAELSKVLHERTKITATREGFALIGVVLAAALPAYLGATQAEGVAKLAWIFAVLLTIAVVIALGGAPVGTSRVTPVRMGRVATLGSLFDVLKEERYRKLLAVFSISGIAAAIPASLVLFFIADVLKAEAQSGSFLALYFVSGAAGLPLWVWLSRRIGKLQAWSVGMLVAIAAFVWAAFLGPGDTLAFASICAFSGLALGADLALPASVLADVSGDDKESGAGAYFGWWNFVSKLNLALAAGLALPLLEILGYTPGSSATTAHTALALIYAGLPAILKLISVVLLWHYRKAIEGEPL